MKPVDMGATDAAFRDLVAAKIGLEEIRPCYTCGSCTGVCPVREVVDDFDPRRIIHMIVLGMKQDVLSSDLIWYCCLCNSCYYVCPAKLFLEDAGHYAHIFCYRSKIFHFHPGGRNYEDRSAATL